MVPKVNQIHRVPRLDKSAATLTERHGHVQFEGGVRHVKGT
jgi:hypothetical protein